MAPIQNKCRRGYGLKYQINYYLLMDNHGGGQKHQPGIVVR